MAPCVDYVFLIKGGNLAELIYKLGGGRFIASGASAVSRRLIFHGKTEED